MSEVVLNVYDISNGMAKSMSQQFLGKYIEGIWHTGVVVFGTEFFFGGGICEAAPKTTPYGFPIKEIHLGWTEIPEDVFREFLAGISSSFSEETYDLINHNCNNFTNEACMFLIGKGIPEDILMLPQEILSTPLGRMVEPMMKSVTESIKGQSAGMEIAPPMIPPGMPSAPPAMPASGNSHDSVREITSCSELEHLIASSPAVIVDFWSPSCGPCLSFKPYFHEMANKNQVKQILFCAVNVQNNRESGSKFGISAIPTLHFYFHGKFITMFQGANPPQLQIEYQNLQRLVENTHPHSLLEFKNFTPESKEKQYHSGDSQKAAMIKTICTSIESSANKEKYESLKKFLEALSENTKTPFGEDLLESLMELMKELPLEKRLPLLQYHQELFLMFREDNIFPDVISFYCIKFANND